MPVVTFQEICDEEILKAKQGTFADGLREGFSMAKDAVTRYADQNFLKDEEFVIMGIEMALKKWEENIGIAL